MKCLIICSVICALQTLGSSSPVAVAKIEEKKKDVPVLLLPVGPVVPVVPSEPKIQEQIEVKKEEVIPSVLQVEPVETKKKIEPIVKPVIPPVHQDDQIVDPSFALSDPIDTATKLLIDLEEHVLKFLPSDAPVEEVSLNIDALDTTTTVPVPSPPIYIGGDGIDGVDLASIAKQQATPSQQATMNTLLEQLDVLQTSISDTINQLTARRRYVMAAMLRPLSTYVRRVRSNLERLQNRINSLQTFATAGPGAAAGPPGPPVGAAPIDQGVMASIRRQVEQIQKQIAGIMNRISQSLSLPPPFTGLGSTAAPIS